MRRIAAGLVTALSVLAACRPAAAQGADEFYKGRQIRVIVGTAAGQDYDAWARLIGRHMGAFMPGNPGFVIENMPGPPGRQGGTSGRTLCRLSARPAASALAPGRRLE